MSLINVNHFLGDEVSGSAGLLAILQIVANSAMYKTLLQEAANTFPMLHCSSQSPLAIKNKIICNITTRKRFKDTFSKIKKKKKKLDFSFLGLITS